MVGFDGTQLNAHLKFLIRDLKIGGIILFSQNVEAPGQLKKMCAAVQEYAAINGQPPLLIAIDQEGGQVARLKEPFTQFPGNPAMKDVADAVYFAMITGLTVGYGDITPQSGGGRIIAVMVALVGVIFSGLVVAIALRAVGQSLKKPKSN